MLKIKDNVDLKELEKYGFKKKYYNVGKILVLECETREVHCYQDIVFDFDTRRLLFCNWGYDALWDLRKADLGEKGENDDNE